MAFVKESEQFIGSFSKGRDKVVVTCGKMNGKAFIDARVNFITGEKSDSWQPTQKGLFLSYEQAQLLVEYLRDALAFVVDDEAIA